MHRHAIFSATAATLFWSAAALAVAPGGIPDPSFGAGDAPPGFAIESVDTSPSGQDRAYALTESNGGKLLLAGAVTGEGQACIGLMRFSADGVLDQSFGAGGKICHPLILGAAFQVQFADFSAVSLPGGKTLVGGNALDTQQFSFVCRFLENGAKDLGFGSGQTPGCRVLPRPVSSSQKDIAPVIAADAQSILVLTDPAQGDIPLLTRLSAVDGTLQPYGQDPTTPILPPSVFAAAVARDAALTPDGDLLVAGAALRGGKFVAFVSRFDLAEGQSVPTFGEDGARVIEFGDAQASANSIRVFPAGETLIAAVVQSSDGELAGLAQISSVTGTSDPDFNGGDVSLFPACEIEQCDITNLQIERSPDGRIFLGGAIEALGDESIFAARVNPDGTPDAPYGPAPKKGIATFESKTEARAEMVLQGDNVVLGGTLNLQQTSDFVLVRLGDENIFTDGFESPL